MVAAEDPRTNQVVPTAHPFLRLITGAAVKAAAVPGAGPFG